MSDMDNQIKEEMNEDVKEEMKESEENAKEKADDKSSDSEFEQKDKDSNADDADVIEKEAAEKEEEEDGWEVKYMRLMADFQNYKRRVEKEKQSLYSYANEKIVTELLGVMDNFERALSHDAEEGIKEGMEMIFKQMVDVLEKSGLAEIEALGQDFDPNVHNAVMTEEPGEYESGKVSGVMQKGYTLNGKVIRPAMVKVVN